MIYFKDVLLLCTLPQTSAKDLELVEGPYVVNVSAAITMITLDKLIDGLTYTFSVST